MFKLLLQKLGTGASVRSVSFEENILKSAVFVALKLFQFHVSSVSAHYYYYPVPLFTFVLGYPLMFSWCSPTEIHSLSLNHWRTCFPVVQVHQRHIYTTKLSIPNPNNSKNTTTQNCTSHKTLLLHPPPPSLSLPTKTQWYTFVAATNVVWFFPPPIP